MKKILTLFGTLAISSSLWGNILKNVKIDSISTYQNKTLKKNSNIGKEYYIDGLGNSHEQKNSIPYPITTMYTFRWDSGNRKTGDIYFGTTNGLYLRKHGELGTTRINGIEGTIKIIKSDIVLTNNNDIFSINNDDIAYSLLRKCWSDAITSLYTFNSIIYFGTTNGIFYFNQFNLKPKKIEGINESIAFIQKYSVLSKGFLGTLHVVTTNGNLYYVNEDNRAYRQSDFSYPIISMYTFRWDSGNRKTGDIYFGTTNGLYLRKHGELGTTRINGINDPIAFIEPYTTEGSVHVVTLTSLPNYLENSKIKNENKNLISFKNQNDNAELNISDDAVAYNRSLISMTYNYLLSRRIITESNVIGRGHIFNMGGQGGYFIVNCNVNLPHADQNRRLQLVFDSWNLYLQGFIVRYGNSFTSPGTYFCFNFVEK